MNSVTESRTHVTKLNTPVPKLRTPDTELFKLRYEIAQYNVTECFEDLILGYVLQAWGLRNRWFFLFTVTIRFRSVNTLEIQVYMYSLSLCISFPRWSEIRKGICSLLICQNVFFCWICLYHFLQSLWHASWACLYFFTSVTNVSPRLRKWFASSRLLQTKSRK